MRNRFKGQFHVLTISGAQYHQQQQFRPLSGHGKPLWEFKEHDHRLYCYRKPYEGASVLIVLLNGWVKDKEGKTREEDREIEKAQSLCNEYMNEYPGGNI